MLGVVIGVLLLPWGCVGGSYWRFFFCRGDVLGVVIGVLLLPWGCVGGSYWGFFFCRGDVLGDVLGVVLGVVIGGSSSAVGMCWG